MKHFGAVAFTALVAISSLALGQTPDADATALHVVGPEVLRLDQELENAVRLGHTDYLEKLLATDFVEMQAGGKVLNKRERIDEVKSSPHRVEEIQFDKIQILYASPNVAIVTDTASIGGPRSEASAMTKYRRVRVFVKQEGKWRAVGAGSTQLHELKDPGK
jgi:ketosteroid isomerase-like protein